MLLQLYVVHCVIDVVHLCFSCTKSLFYGDLVPFEDLYRMQVYRITNFGDGIVLVLKSSILGCSFQFVFPMHM